MLAPAPGARVRAPTGRAAADFDTHPRRLLQVRGRGPAKPARGAKSRQIERCGAPSDFCVPRSREILAFPPRPTRGAGHRPPRRARARGASCHRPTTRGSQGEAGEGGYSWPASEGQRRGERRMRGPVFAVAVGALFARGRATAAISAMAIGALMWLGIAALGLSAGWGAPAVGIGWLFGLLGEVAVLELALRREFGAGAVRALVAPALAAAASAASALGIVAMTSLQSWLAALVSVLIGLALYLRAAAWLQPGELRTLRHHIRIRLRPGVAHEG